MTHRVVPFAATIASTDGAAAAANQLQTLIDREAADGWEYVRLEQLDTFVAGSAGCFGIGATPGRSTSLSMAVFRR